MFRRSQIKERVVLSMDERIKAVDRVRRGARDIDIAQEYGVHITTLRSWLHASEGRINQSMANKARRIHAAIAAHYGWTEFTLLPVTDPPVKVPLVRGHGSGEEPGIVDSRYPILSRIRLEVLARSARIRAIQALIDSLPKDDPLAPPLHAELDKTESVLSSPMSEIEDEYVRYAQDHP